jgi:hypothetical protein
MPWRTLETKEGASESFVGVDYEATPFVVLAAAFSLALAAAAVAALIGWSAAPASGSSLA